MKSKTPLEAVNVGWGWKLGVAVEIITTNRFGNAIVKTATGSYYRIVPEELECSEIARSLSEFEGRMIDPEFKRDWEMISMVTRAEKAHGKLSDGQCYYLVKPGVLGGKYSEENIRKIGLMELLSCSGDMAKQIEGLPEGTPIEIKIK